MAILTDIMFTGSLGNLSAYRMKGSDKIILRRKGGPSKRTIKTSRRCGGIRKANMEFGGRSTATKSIRRALGTVRQVADYNFTGYLHKVLRPIQLMDPVNDPGERDVHLTRSPKLLEGFSLNQNQPFDSVIRTPVTYSLDKENRSAKVTIPALMPGINFFPHPYPLLYYFDLALGIVPDLNYSDKIKRYSAHHKYQDFKPAIIHSDWQHVNARTDELILQITTTNIPPDSHHTLILSLGIRYGTFGADQKMELIRRTGSAKILGVA